MAFDGSAVRRCYQEGGSHSEVRSDFSRAQDQFITGPNAMILERIPTEDVGDLNAISLRDAPETLTFFHLVDDSVPCSSTMIIRSRKVLWLRCVLALGAHGHGASSLPLARRDQKPSTGPYAVDGLKTIQSLDQAYGGTISPGDDRQGLSRPHPMHFDVESLLQGQI